MSSSINASNKQNIHSVERTASVALGTMLLYSGLFKKGRFRLLKLVVGGFLVNRGTTGFCVLYDQFGRKSTASGLSAINIRTSLLVNKPRIEVYNYWRRLENLPGFMKHLISVEELNGSLSEWKAQVPGSAIPVSWKAEIVKEIPGSLLGWRSVAGSVIENAGKVEFKDAGFDRTEIRVTISYHPPLGVIGEGIAKLFNSSMQQSIREDIRSFKNIIESAPVANADSVI